MGFRDKSKNGLWKAEEDAEQFDRERASGYLEAVRGKWVENMIL